MLNKTVRELKAIAKERDIRGYYKMRKAELTSLLEVPQRPPRRKSGHSRRLRRADIQPTPEAMNVFEREEFVKIRPTIKSKMNE